MSAQLLNVYGIYSTLRPQFISIWIKNHNANVCELKQQIAKTWMRVLTSNLDGDLKKGIQ